MWNDLVIIYKKTTIFVESTFLLVVNVMTLSVSSVTLDGRMTDELERIWKEGNVV
jgi:hypothetical protein